MNSKIIVDGDCSHKVKRHLFLGKKAMTNLDSILKRRDITLLKKGHIIKAMVCPVVMYGCESWTRKNAELWRFDAFKLWCWRRLLRVPLTARRSNQSILRKSVLNIHWTDWCWSWTSKSLAKNQLIRKDPDARKDWGQKEEEVTEDEIVGWHHWGLMLQRVRRNLAFEQQQQQFSQVFEELSHVKESY